MYCTDISGLADSEKKRKEKILPAAASHNLFLFSRKNCHGTHRHHPHTTYETNLQMFQNRLVSMIVSLLSSADRSSSVFPYFKNSKKYFPFFRFCLCLSVGRGNPGPDSLYHPRLFNDAVCPVGQGGVERHLGYCDSGAAPARRLRKGADAAGVRGANLAPVVLQENEATLSELPRKFRIFSNGFSHRNSLDVPHADDSHHHPPDSFLFLFLVSLLLLLLCRRRRRRRVPVPPSPMHHDGS